MADLTAITARIRELVGQNSGLGATVKIDFGADGKIYVDGKSSPNTVTNDDKAADATVSMSFADFQQIVAGSLDAQAAIASGRIMVAGDLALVQKLGAILRR
jgi:putative sterol carrier protein